MKNNLKTIGLVVLTTIITIWGTVYAVLPSTIDKLNKEIVYSIADKNEAKKNANIKRKEIATLTGAILNMQNELAEKEKELLKEKTNWNKAEGKRRAFIQSIRLLEGEYLGKAQE